MLPDAENGIEHLKGERPLVLLRYSGAVVERLGPVAVQPAAGHRAEAETARSFVPETRRFVPRAGPCRERALMRP